MRSRSTLGLVALVTMLSALAAWWIEGQPRRTAAALGPSDGALAVQRESSKAGLVAAEDASHTGALSARASVELASPQAEAALCAPAIRSRMTGRVIDERRFPSAGATVTLLVPGRDALSAETNAAGEFHIEGFAPATPETPDGSLHAAAPDGRAAVTYHRLREFTAPFEERIADLVLTDARTVTVEVTDEGAPAAGAEVALEVGYGHIVAGLARADDQGRARFDGVPGGSLCASARRVDPATSAARFGSADFATSVSTKAPLRVALGPTRAVTVTARELTSGVPLEGVLVFATHSVMPPRTFTRAGDEDWPGSRRVIGVRGVTDIAGRVVLTGLPFEEVLLQAPAGDAGYDGDARTRIGAEATEAVLEVPSSPRRGPVTWPIVAGEVPTPLDGTALTLRPMPGIPVHDRGAWPIAGRVRGTEIVVEDLHGGSFGALAATEGGALAALFLRPGETVGRDAKFVPARTVTVHVSDASGRPAAGWGVQASRGGGNLLGEPVVTDAAGMARCTPLIGQLVDVSVLPEGQRYGGWSVGSVDLRLGDAELRFTLPDTFIATMRILIDGAARLPARISLQGATVESEDPERALLRASFRLAHDAQELRVFVRARGYRVDPLVLTRADLQGGAPIDVHLSTSGTLAVELLRVGETPVALVAERALDDGSWRRLGAVELEYPNSEDGLFRFDELQPGRHRVRDQKSGLASEPVLVDPLAGEARIVFDLTRTGVARGRVTVPEGFDLSLARVIVDGDGVAIEAGRVWELPRGTPSQSVPVRSDGAFELPVSVDLRITLRAWHPELACASEGGSATLVGPRDDVTLALVDGTACVCVIPERSGRRPAESLHVLLYEDAACTRLASEHLAPIRDGRARFAGFTPGVYTIWIDPGDEWAPLVLEERALGEGRTDLGQLEFRAGSSLRVRMTVAPSASAPRVFVSAFSDALGPDGQPLYNRQLSSRGEAEVVLAGLGPGTFRVRCSTIGGADLLGGRLVTVDGERDEVLEVAP